MKNRWRMALTIGAIVTITVVLTGQSARPAPASGGNGTLLDDLVVANRILANESILDGLGHVSVRSLQRPDHFFLSRDLAPGLVMAADLVEYGLDGNPVNPKAPQGYRERFLHAAIFKARPDVNSIVHSHMPSVLPFTDVTTPLRPMYHMASFLLQGAPVFEVRSVQGQIGMLIDNNKVGDALAQTLGNRTIALIRGHGAAIVGTTIPDAVQNAIFHGRQRPRAGAGGGTWRQHFVPDAADVAGGNPNPQPPSPPGTPGLLHRVVGESGRQKRWEEKAME